METTIVETVHIVALILIAAMVWDNARAARALRRDLDKNAAITDATLVIAREILRKANG